MQDKHVFAISSELQLRTMYKKQLFVVRTNTVMRKHKAIRNRSTPVVHHEKSYKIFI